MQKNIKERIFVFDTETIPDSDALRKVFGYDGSDMEVALKAQEEQFNKTGSSFLPVYFHKIVCISAVVADEYGRFMRVSTIDGKNEKEKIVKFLNLINAYNPRMVSFNGRGFDFPMIMARAMKYNIDANAYYEVENKEFNKTKWENYRSRYIDRFHCDLMDQISDFGSVRGMKLDEICKTVGLPGKFDTHGDEVLELFYDKKLDEIEQYCESDTLNTYWLFLKFELLKGMITKSDYLSYIDEMKEYLIANKANYNYTSVFVQHILNEIKTNK